MLNAQVSIVIHSLNEVYVWKITKHPVRTYGHQSIWANTCEIWNHMVSCHLSPFTGFKSLIIMCDMCECRQKLSFGVSNYIQCFSTLLLLACACFRLPSSAFVVYIALQIRQKIDRPERILSIFVRIFIQSFFDDFGVGLFCSTCWCWPNGNMKSICDKADVSGCNMTIKLIAQKKRNCFTVLILNSIRKNLNKKHKLNFMPFNVTFTLPRARKLNLMWRQNQQYTEYTILYAKGSTSERRKNSMQICHMQ